MATVEEERRQDEKANPLVEGLERLPVHPTTAVIFGKHDSRSRATVLKRFRTLGYLIGGFGRMVSPGSMTYR